MIPPRGGSARSIPVVVAPAVTVTGSPVPTENLLLYAIVSEPAMNAVTLYPPGASVSPVVYTPALSVP